jgi:hypothetical protein
MLVVRSVMAVDVNSASSSVVVVAASKHWVSASGTTAIAPEIEGTKFALASADGSSVVT